MQGELRLGTLAGIEIRVNYTWLFAFILIAWSLAQGYFPSTYTRLGTGTYWVLGLVAALLLFGSVLVHELGHSVVAGARGLGVQSITPVHLRQSIKHYLRGVHGRRRLSLIRCIARSMHAALPLRYCNRGTPGGPTPGIGQERWMVVIHARRRIMMSTSTQAAGQVSTKAAWPVFMAKLQSRQEVADGTMAFHFEKPSDWAFEAGQFIDVTLLEPEETDPEGNTRGFSIASAPFENTLLIATRMRDTAFKRVLKTLPLGSEVKIEGPFGDLRLHNNVVRPAVVVSGGIGITPFRSILLQAAKEKRPHRIFFFYANRRPEDAPFLDDVRALARENPSFTFVPTMTEMDKSHLPWDGERGRIDQKMLAKYLTGVTSAIYYLTGPPGMVKGLRTVLKASGVDDDDIRTEEFTGY